MGTRCWARWRTTVPPNTAPKTSRSPSTERRLTQLAVSSRQAADVAGGATGAGSELFSENAPSFVSSRGRAKMPRTAVAEQISRYGHLAHCHSMLKHRTGSTQSKRMLLEAIEGKRNLC